MVKLANIINNFIPGDWGEDQPSTSSPIQVYCIRGADIVPISANEFDGIPTRYISKSSFERKKLRAGDLIIEKSGGSPTQSTGRIVYVSKELIENKKNIVCSNFCVALRIKEEYNPLYVYYYWQYIYNLGAFFNFEGKTSGLKNLQLESALSTISFYNATMKKQNEIARSLALIERKINLNRAINHNLEAMAKQLYDYWFVQFDFPDENGRPYKSSGGKMVWNEKLKREIPEGWHCGQLCEIANITMGQSPDGSSYNRDRKGEIFYQGSSDFGLRFPSIRLYTTAPTHLATKGDILMSVRAPVGAMNIANNNCCIGRGLAALNSKIGSITHLYFIIDGLKMKFNQQNASGTTFGSITKDELYALSVIIPSISILNRFEKICGPTFQKQMVIGEETKSLTTLRDPLLPLLMNGQATITSD